MNKMLTAVLRHIYECMILLYSCLVLFSGCGLTEYYNLAAPTVTYNVPSYSTTDYTSKYFEFRTNDNGNDFGSDADFDFLGTAVYYKIFNNYSTMLSYNSAISAVNTASNSTAAATKMIETYTYQQLGTSSGTETPLIPENGGTDRKVYIRLMNYDKTSSKVSGSVTDYKAKIMWKNATDTDYTEVYVPLREGNRYTFDFNRTTDNTNNAVPASGDTDTVYGTASASNTWYVDMYAVSVGRDSSYTTSYSLVLHLGAVAISSDSSVNN